MYNKGIQLHTNAKSNVTSGYHTVRALYNKNTGDVISNVYTYLNPWYKCTFTIALPLVIVQRREANIFGRGDYGTEPACRRLRLKLGDAETSALLYVIKQNYSQKTSWNSKALQMLALALFRALQSRSWKYSPLTSRFLDPVRCATAGWWRLSEWCKPKKKKKRNLKLNDKKASELK